MQLETSTKAHESCKSMLAEIQASTNLKQIEEKLRKNKHMLSKALDYFVVYKGDASEALQNFSQKWNDGKVISETMKTYVLEPLAQTLSLSLAQTFCVLNEHFLAKYKQLLWCRKLEEKISELEKLHCVGLQQIPLQQRFDQFKQELSEHHALIIKETTSFYFEERKALLSLIQIVVAQFEQPLVKVKEEIIKANLAENLVKSLSKILEWQTDFKNIDQKDTLILNLQEEQITILRILFALVYARGDAQSPQVTADFLKYLRQTEFTGNFLGSEFRMGRPNLSYLQKLNLVKSLSQLTFTAMLNIHQKHPSVSVTADGENEVNKLLANCQAVPASIFFAFPVAQIKKNSTLDAILKQYSHVVEVQQLMDSQIFTTEQFQDLRGPAAVLLLHWLDMAFDYTAKVETMASKEKTLKLSEIQEHCMILLGERASIETVWDSGLEKPKIVKAIIENRTDRFPAYIKLMERLCGKSQFPHAERVLEKLKQHQTLPELFGWIAKFMGELESQCIDEPECQALCHALVTLAKIIKQKPQCMRLLHSAYLETRDKRRSENHQFQFERASQNYYGLRQSASQFTPSCGQLEDGDLPILDLLMRALHGLAAVEKTITFTLRAQDHIISALAQMYKAGFKREVIDRFQRQPAQQLVAGCPRILEHFGSLVQVARKSGLPKVYKVQATFLDFLTLVLSSNPNSYLNREDRISLDKTFFNQALQRVFQPLLLEYFGFQHNSFISMARFTASMIQLATVLLKKFDLVPEQRKCELRCAKPSFDFELELLTQVLEHSDVHEICLDVLRLSESHSNRTAFENRFLNNVKQELSELGPSVALKMSNLLRRALQLLDTLTSLAYASEEKQTLGMTDEHCIRNVSFISRLNPVAEIRSLIKSPIQSRTTLQGVPISFIAMTVHYMRPAPEINSPLLVAEALTLAANAIRLAGDSLDLETLLRQTFGHQLRTHIMTQLESSFKNDKVNYAKLAWLQFLLQASETQPRLMQELFQMTDNSTFLHVLREETGSSSPEKFTQADLRNDSRLLLAKLCCLIATLGKKQLAVEMLLHQKHELVARLEPFVFKLLEEHETNRSSELSQLKFTSLLDEEMSDVFAGGASAGQNKSRAQLGAPAKVLQVKSSLISKVTIAAYAEILATEFERNPAYPVIGSLIQRLTEKPGFASLSANSGKISQQVSKIQALASRANKEYLQDGFALDFAYNQQMKRYAQTTHPDSSALESAHAGIQLSERDLEGGRLVASAAAMWNFLPRSTQLTKTNLGQIGQEFCIDTPELQRTLLAEGYDCNVVDQLIELFQETNLMLSTLFVDLHVFQVKIDFVSRVGQTAVSRLRRPMAESWLPLVSEVKSAPVTASLQTRLIKVCMEHISAAQVVLRGNESLQASNQLYKALRNKVAENMLTHLALISSLPADCLARHKSDLENEFLRLLTACAEFASDELMCRIALQLTRILASLGTKLKQLSILKVLARILDQMQANKQVLYCIQLYQNAIELLDFGSLKMIFEKNDNMPLRAMLVKLADPDAQDQEISSALSLLNTYAQNSEGAVHLRKCNVLEHILRSRPLRLISRNERYVQQHEGVKRSPAHIQWCQTMVLLRELNSQLLENPITSHSQYFLSYVKFIRAIKPQIAETLGTGLYTGQTPAGSHNSSIVSMALLEEAELACGLLQPLFEHCDLWNKEDAATFSELKDHILFAVPKLFETCDAAVLQPRSLTEQHLATLVPDNVNQPIPGAAQLNQGFVMKAEICLVNIFETCSTCLFHLLNMQKQHNKKNQALLNTWGNRVVSASQQHSVAYLPSLEKNFLSFQEEQPIKLAYRFYREGQKKLIQKYRQFHDRTTNAEQTLENMHTLFQMNPWVANEYSGGLGNQLLPEGTEDFYEQMDFSIALSMSVATMLLEFLAISISDINYYDTMGGRLDFEHNYLEERQVAHLCKDQAALIVDPGPDIRNEMTQETRETLLEILQLLQKRCSRGPGGFISMSNT